MAFVSSTVGHIALLFILRRLRRTGESALGHRFDGPGNLGSNGRRGTGNRLFRLGASADIADITGSILFHAQRLVAALVLFLFGYDALPEDAMVPDTTAEVWGLR